MLKNLISVVEENNLLFLSDKELQIFFKSNKELKQFVSNLYSSLFKFCRKSFKFKLKSIYKAYSYSLDSWSNIKSFINEQLIDKENEVSPSKLNFLIKINPEIKNQVLLLTDNYPEKFTIVGRCELIRKDIKEFPICPVCNKNHVGWTNASKLHQFCSLKCQANSIEIHNKRKETLLKTTGVDHVWKRKEGELRGCEKTNLKRYGVENTGGLDFVRKKREQTTLKRYGSKHNWSVKGERREIMQDKIREVCQEKYGVDNVSQVFEFQNKASKTSLTKKKYKDTELVYQGSYERYFLELLEENNLLSKTTKPKSVKYTFNNKEKYYFPDFQIDDIIVEIKSTWTYDRCGKDLEGRLRNEAKWREVRKDKKLIVLFNKEQIKNFIMNYPHID